MSVLDRPRLRAAPARRPAPPRASSGRRDDIQALRALAVAAVVVEHFWPNRLTGGYLGVDVFFVISGFLITSHLVREISTTGRIRLGSFWMRRVRRLLPAALTVIAATALLSALALPPTQWQQLARHMLASVFYVQNWALAAESSDYFARSVATSPLMHLWSLSVEEQFYLLWPLLLIGAAAWARGRLLLHQRMTLAVLAVCVVSCTAAIALTPDLPSAYYSTPLRAWEFAVGALCALIRSPRLSARTSTAVAACAGAVLIVCMVVYTPEQGVPGAAALLPVLATGVVLLVGRGMVPATGRVLAAAPVRWLGASSYSMYLWHWPLLICASALSGGSPGLVVEVLLLALTCVLAHLTRTQVEQRFVSATPADNESARSAGRRAIVFVLSGVAVVGLLAATGLGFVAARTSAAPVASSTCLGAAVLENAASCGPAHARPAGDVVLGASSRVHVSGDRSGIYCIQDRDASDVRSCNFGVSADASTARVALVGDSHAGQWVDPLAAIARSRGWHVDLFLKSSCPVVDRTQPVTAVDFPDSAGSCASWRSSVAKAIDRGRYDVIMTSAYASAYAGRNGAPLPTSAFTATWRRWIDAGSEVVALADTPRFDVGFVPDCIAATRGDDPCTAPSSAALRPDPMTIAAARLSDPAFTWIDLNSVRCDASRCHTVLGGIVTVGDGDHMTSDFARSLTPLMRVQLAPVG